MKSRNLLLGALVFLLISGCSQVQQAIDTGKQVIDTAQGLRNVCTVAELTWTTELSPKEASKALKNAVKELKAVIALNQDIVPESKALLRDLQLGIKELDAGMSKKELKEAVASIQSLCSGFTAE